jgi:hypothetical protein
LKRTGSRASGACPLPSNRTSREWRSGTGLDVYAGRQIRPVMTGSGSSEQNSLARGRR